MLRNRLLVGLFSFYGEGHGSESALGQQNKPGLTKHKQCFVSFFRFSLVLGAAFFLLVIYGQNEKRKK
jgi:hypothetical protein